MPLVFKFEIIIPDYIAPKVFQLLAVFGYFKLSIWLLTCKKLIVCVVLTCFLIHTVFLLLSAEFLVNKVYFYIDGLYEALYIFIDCCKHNV